MNEIEQASTLIGDIYDAALDPALWSSVLEQTCQFVKGCNAGLLAHDLVQDKGHLHLQWGTDPRYVELYEKVYAKLNLYCGPVLRHPAELMLPAVDLGGRVWLDGRSCKGGPAAPAFGG